MSYQSIILVVALLVPAKGHLAEPIKIAINDWTSQVVMSHIAATLLQKIGYKTSFVHLTTDSQWLLIGRGRVHLQLEVWEGTMAKPYHRLMDTKSIVDLGDHSAKTREEWWYPDYVEKYCPGLPNWEALKTCYGEFATADSDGRGVYLGGPWEKPDAKRVKALDLKFNITRVSHGDELWIHLDDAFTSKKPIVLFNWTPNWVEYKYSGKFVEFPEHTIECETDPFWGVNQYYTHDCGNPKGGWLKKIAWVDFPLIWPCAYQVVKRMDFSNPMIAEMAYWVDGQQMKYEEAAKLWVKTKQHIWQNWIPPECAEEKA